MTFQSLHPYTAPGCLASALRRVVARPRRYASLRRVERTRITSVHFLARFRLSLSLISRGWTPTGDWRRRTRRRRAREFLFDVEGAVELSSTSRILDSYLNTSRTAINTDSSSSSSSSSSSVALVSVLLFVLSLFVVVVVASSRAALCWMPKPRHHHNQTHRVPKKPYTFARRGDSPIPRWSRVFQPLHKKPRAPKPSQNSSSRAPRRSSSSTSSAFHFQSHHITTGLPRRRL